jgi:putative endonuclease
VVAAWLEERGYAIVAINLHVGRLELDVVARRGRLIVVVEVRTRGASSWQGGFASIDHKKRARIRQAGERLWRDRYEKDSSVERMRFDAASVHFEEGRTVVEYAIAAF